MTFTTADARETAAGIAPELFESLCTIDWTRVHADKRKGNIYAWNASADFIGQFRNHEKAREAGAHITRIGVTSNWFIWPVRKDATR